VNSFVVLERKSKTNDLAIMWASNPHNYPPIPHHRQSEYRCGGSTPEVLMAIADITILRIPSRLNTIICTLFALFKIYGL